MEPDFIVQTNEPMTPEQRRGWCHQQRSEAIGKGATWHRFALLPDVDLLLYEGWKERPDHEGKPRFQLMRPRDTESRI